MTWMLLDPGEIEAIRERRIDDADIRPAAILVRTIQGKLKGDELTLTGAEIAACRDGLKDWKNGFVKVFRAVLAAADRH